VTLFTDNVTAAIERGLSGVAERQRVTANNIANQATPGFTAGKVDFEADLAAAIEKGDPAGARTTQSLTTDAPGIDGNNVSLEGETTTMIRSGLQYDALVTALNYKLNLLHTAITSR
jgi:flagellar basal-body rod protein FlgB